MSKISINDKVYNGENIFSGKKDNIEFSIYCLNNVSDKYLIINKNGDKMQDFVITGVHKVYEIIELIKNDSPKAVESQIDKMLLQFHSRCYNKSLRRTNAQTLKELVFNYYDTNYQNFVFIGVKLPELVKKVETEYA